MARKTAAAGTGQRRTPGVKIKKGDLVLVIAGRDIGREGRVIKVIPDKQKVLVQGVNMIRKNTKVNYQGYRGGKEGGIVNTEALIHVSNVQLIDPESKRPTRAGYRLGEVVKEADGEAKKVKVRISRATGRDT